MTTPVPGTADVRRLLAEARAVVEAIDRIAAADDARARDFGAYLAGLAHRHWDDLRAAVATADADRFARRLQPLVALTVPLEDRPESAAPAAELVHEQMVVLARDMRLTIESQLTPDMQLPAPVLASMAAGLRAVADDDG